MKSAVFESLFYDKYCSVEKENVELKLVNKVLELQLNTLKRKNEELNSRNDAYVRELKNEVVEILIEQLAVSSRINRVLDILNEL